MPILKKNILGLFVDKLLLFPLWVKQILYLRLYQNLSTYLSEDFISVKEEDIFHLHVPSISFAGKSEIIERKGGLDNNIYTFLVAASENLSMLEISMNNFWTMEEVAKYYILCLEQNFVKIPDSVYIQAMAGFMAGKFRTGEYFKRIGKIDVDQLEQTILKQKEYAEKGTPMKMAEIMISLGFITEKDTSSLLEMKEEAKKRFILDASIIPKEAETNATDFAAYKDEIAKLTEQNNILKEKLGRLLLFLKQQQK